MNTKTSAAAPWNVWTWPNLVTMIRFAGIPVFCYLLIATHHYIAALVVLAVGGGTDWVDGFLARRLGQVSRFGRLLDPLVDRLYILVAVVVLTGVGLLPWQFTSVLLVREVVMAATVLALRWRGYEALQVHYVGKTATFVIFASFPVFVLAGLHNAAEVWARPLGWALAWWGITLYWLSAAIYIVQAVGLLRAARAPTPTGRP
ncbi:MAG TPA: CDP-alcohol phosphatidyltransferase family protein [Stackebrandtia sp.]|uniref:CDP-alcohol phosphatidyltransferase family protein n=1 Tax=Stackebrandtia sp. TaxID=2023065 RepID=UPI002D5B4B17|nr:CDP-alcohol phosphatidyltransferase family protein [Stackebrandtia sp.]HZE37183.1 CDP-alcohol phosphatidyltransferase family protein [Stackebrandtia sp.]